MSDEVKLLPCRECGSDCRIEKFGATELIANPFDLFVCSNHQRFGGDCPSDLAYFNAEAWNTRAIEATDEVVERVARAIEDADDAWFETRARDRVGTIWQAMARAAIEATRPTDTTDFER